jgi:hypothetical protein
MRRWVLSLGLALLAGCMHDPKPTLIPAAPPTPPTGQVVQVGHSAAAEATAATGKRVLTLAQKIAAANPRMGLKLSIQTLGNPQPTIFHRLDLDKDFCQVWISEGLVNQCQSEGQLAAVLCMELGRAASEKAALKPPALRGYIEPPPNVPIGNDAGDFRGSPDQTHMAELAKVDEARHRREQMAPPAPPPPDVLACAYLKRAGYAAADLQAVSPLLRAAAKNTDIEKQMLGKLQP